MGAVVRTIAIADAVVACLATALWVGTRVLTGSGLPSHAPLIAAVPALWLGSLAVSGGFDRRVAVTGADAYRRIGNAAAWLIAGGALVSFAFRADIERGYVFAAVPLCAVLTIGVHFTARKQLHRRLSREDVSVHRALAVGTAAEVRDLVTHLRRAPYAGFRIVAAWTPQHDGGELPDGVRRIDTDVRELPVAAAEIGADTIALAGAHVLSGLRLRELSWGLEGSDVDLVVVPAVTDLAGPRIHVRPLEGLPLLHIERPQFTGAQRLLKNGIDRAVAALLLVALSPLLAAVAVAVRVLGGPGPVLFRQTRVGLGGHTFTLYKFRTMRSGADRERAALQARSDVDGAMFKLRRDPRVTALGRHLRRWSLDELPQIWNVATGSMSLVGPRPPLVDEVEGYGHEARRRLLVKPGLTGLWQVSGRSDLPWSECVRLDLYYIENWSVTFDLLVLWKTVRAVLRGQGAY
jgi:exopolysaccharide biosynthesis polyprenyl glycosylphosphotransferase